MQETLVDSRFIHLAADFQDQLDELKIKVKKLETKKGDNIEINTPSYHHALQKRQAIVSKKPNAVCLSSSSICTSYFPDHPDANNDKRKFGLLVKNISSSFRSLCTLYFPDHPDAYAKKDNSSVLLLVPNELTKSTDGKTIGGMQTPPEDSSETKGAVIKGMPTSCTDLKLLGHKLNGIYSVKTQQTNQTTKMETVYCDFQSSSDSNGN